MKRAIQKMLTFTPSFINVTVRRLMGQKIGKNTKIRFGTYLVASEVNLGSNCRIGPLSLISLESLSTGNNCVIKGLTYINTRKVVLHNYVHIANLVIVISGDGPNARLELHDHCRVFPFVWIEPGEGVTVGRQSSVGGHTQIFTHSSWADYLNGGPVMFEPVTIGDNVWLPMRVFIMPGITIQNDTIIGADSFVNKNFPPNVLAAGSPAKILKEGFYQPVSEEEQREKLMVILKKFHGYIQFKGYASQWLGNCLLAGDLLIGSDIDELNAHGQYTRLLFSLKKYHTTVSTGKNIIILDHQDKKMINYPDKNKMTEKFILFIRDFGIRIEK